MSARQHIKNITLTAAMVAILEVAKFLLNAIANVELITLLFIVFTRSFGWKITMAASFVFSFLECLWWGFGTWSIVYFYMWPLLILATVAIKDESLFANALLAGTFGLLFGGLSALSSVVLFGVKTAFSWWISGIPYDLVHCVSNTVITLLLYKPLCRAMRQIKQRYAY